MVGPSGTIISVAGNGIQGFGGDGGPATSASVNNPRAVALDPKGDLFIADAFNHRVRRVRLSPLTRIRDLIRDVQALRPAGMGGQAQLRAALDALSQAPPDVQGAIDSLQAFINFVNAQAGKKIPLPEADRLKGEAQAILDLLMGRRPRLVLVGLRSGRTDRSAPACSARPDLGYSFPHSREGESQ